MEKEKVELETILHKKLNTIGNIVASDVPISKDEEHNTTYSTWGQPSTLVVDGNTLG